MVPSDGILNLALAELGCAAVDVWLEPEGRELRDAPVVAVGGSELEPEPCPIDTLVCNTELTLDTKEDCKPGATDR